MLKRPIFEENNMNYLNDQPLKTIVFKNEEEKIEKEELNKLVYSTNFAFKEEIKNSEA